MLICRHKRINAVFFMFQAAYPFKSMMLLEVVLGFPRLSMLIMYIVDFEGSFLPLIHCVTGNATISMYDKNVSGLKNYTQVLSSTKPNYKENASFGSLVKSFYDLQLILWAYYIDVVCLYFSSYLCQQPLSIWAWCGDLPCYQQLPFTQSSCLLYFGLPIPGQCSIQVSDPVLLSPMISLLYFWFSRMKSKHKFHTIAYF